MSYLKNIKLVNFFRIFRDRWEIRRIYGMKKHKK